MARLSRIIAVGYPHHLTQRGVRSMAIFQSDGDRHCYLQHVKEETERFGVEILSWCLMTNHVHFIAVPKEETSFARGFGEAHRKYTRMKNFADGVRGYLFQGRFGSCVLDERHLSLFNVGDKEMIDCLGKNPFVKNSIDFHLIIS